jgi:peptidylprolyl isomerase
MTLQPGWSVIRDAGRRPRPRAACALATLALLASAGTGAETATVGEILVVSPPSDWRRPDPAQTLYLELPQGVVVFELAPAFAPRHLANLRALVRARWFDGLAINRVQDNFVVQWGDPGPGTTRPLPRGVGPLPAEFARAGDPGPRFVPLPDVEGYAPRQGFLDGFAVASDRAAGADAAAGEAWLAHCYGTLAVGREEAVDSGTAAELYVVIGHAPRQLERNATVLGRALAGMELLAAMPRGAAAMGFYESPSQRVPIVSLRFGDEVPAARRLPLELLRTDSATFARVVEARRNRRDAWYVHPAGHVDLCSVPLPVRRGPPRGGAPRGRLPDGLSAPVRARPAAREACRRAARCGVRAGPGSARRSARPAARRGRPSGAGRRCSRLRRSGSGGCWPGAPRCAPRGRRRCHRAAAARSAATRASGPPPGRGR